MNTSQQLRNYSAISPQRLPLWTNMTGRETLWNWTEERKGGPPLWSGFQGLEEIPYVFDDPMIQAIFLTLYSIVFFFCFFGNLTVVLVLSLHWKMRSITKFCLRNLAFANLCVGIFCIYQNLSLYLMDNWVFGDFMCKMYHFTNSCSWTASILILIVISIERYLVILHPFKCRLYVTMKRLKILILGIWVVSAFLCAPKLYFIETITNTLHTGDHEVICSILANVYDTRTTDLFQFLFLFILPLVLMIVLYTKIALYLRHQHWIWDSVLEHNKKSIRRRNSSSHHPSRSFRWRVVVPKAVKVTLCPTNSCSPYGGQLKQSCGTKTKTHKSSISQNHVCAVRLLIVTVCTFTLCNLPFHLRKLYQYFWPLSDFDSVFSDYATPLTFLMMYLNSAINPFLFAFISQGFRSCLLELLACQGRRKNRVGNSQINSRNYI